jgi:hypothetical protein
MQKLNRRKCPEKQIEMDDALTIEKQIENRRSFDDNKRLKMDDRFDNGKAGRLEGVLWRSRKRR